MTVKLLIESLDVSTRRKRRAATALAIRLLEKIHAAEVAYLEKMPANLHDGENYAISEDAADIIIDAIVELCNAYE